MDATDRKPAAKEKVDATVKRKNVVLPTQGNKKKKKKDVPAVASLHQETDDWDSLLPRNSSGKNEAFLAVLKEQEDMAKAAQKERKEAENLRQEEDDRREVDRLIDKYPKNPYMYSTFF